MRPALLRAWLAACCALVATATALADPGADQHRVAAQHYAQGRWELAAAEFRTLRDDFAEHPLSQDAEFYLAESLIQLGRYREAREPLGNFLKAAPDNPLAAAARFRRGEAAYLLHEWISARAELNAFLKKHGEHPLAAYATAYLADAAFAEDDLAQAERLYRDALARFPDGPLAAECRFGLGRVLEQQHKLAEAADVYTDLGADAASDVALRARLQRATVEYRQGDAQTAAATLKPLVQDLEAGPLKARALYWLGLAQKRQGDLGAAAKSLAAAAQNSPDAEIEPAIAYQAGETDLEADRLNGAQQHFEKVLAGWPLSRWADDSLWGKLRVAVARSDDAAIDSLLNDFEQRFPDSPLGTTARQAVARHFLQREDFPRAAAVLEPVPQKELPAAERYLLGLAFEGQQKHEQALSALTAALTGADDALRVPIQIAQGTVLIAMKQFARALEPLEAALKTADGQQAAYCRGQLAICYARLKRLDEARGALATFQQNGAETPQRHGVLEQVAEAVLAADPAWSATLFASLAEEGPAERLSAAIWGRARAEYRLGQSDRAAKSCAELLERFAESPQAADAAWLHAYLLEKTDADRALPAYLELAERYPESPHAAPALFRAATLYDRNRQFAKAETLLERLLQEFPQWQRTDAVLYQRAWMLLELGRADEAFVQLQRLTREHPQSDFWVDATYRLAEQALKDKDFNDCGRRLESLLRSDRAAELRPYALYLAGQLALAREDWTGLDVRLTTLVAEFPTNPLRLASEYWLAESAFRQQKRDDAKQRFDALEKQIEGRNDAWLGTVPLRRAQLLAERRQWVEAERIAGTIAQRFPDFPQQHEADYLRGRCLAAQAHFEEARAAYRRVVESKGAARGETAAMAQWMIGETYFHQRDYTQAVREFFRVEALYAYPRWQAASLLEVGKCYQQLGEAAKARAVLQQLVERFPETSFARDARQRLGLEADTTPRMESARLPAAPADSSRQTATEDKKGTSP